MKMVALGEVVDFYSGGTPSKAKAHFWEGDVPWFSAKDMKYSRLKDSSRHISKTVFSSTPLRKLPAGTVVMVVRGMILAHTAPIAILDVDGAINQDLKALLPQRGIEPTFLAAMLRARHAEILAQVSTAAHGTKKLEGRVLENLQIPLPSIAEQDRIAAILDHAEFLRARRRQVLAHLDALTQSIFHDMFGTCAWSATLADLAEVQIGPFGSLLHKADYVSGGVPVINPTHIRAGKLEADPSFSVSDEKACALGTYRLKVGDIVLGRRGEMARAGVAMLQHEGMLCGTGSLILRPKQVDSIFLHGVVSSRRMKDHLEKHALGATLPNLNANIVESSPAPDSPRKLQLQYARLIRMVSTHVSTVRRALAADDELFAALQSRAFRGEL